MTRDEEEAALMNHHTEAQQVSCVRNRLPTGPVQQLFLAAILLLSWSSTARACNIPVFRYALERWNTDQTEIIVFSAGALTNEESLFVSQLQQKSAAAGGPSNSRVIPVAVTDGKTETEQQLWESLRQSHEQLPLPFVVARSRTGRNRIVNHWNASLRETMQSGLLNTSPARREIVKRVLAGDAVVWLVLQPDTDAASKAAATACSMMLQEQCRVLSRKLELPDGIGLPGSELYSEVPLLLQFSVLEVSGKDPAERYLVEQLAGFQQQAWDSGQPLVVPVFGRGRVLEVIPAADMSPQLMQELSSFLCGACSCQVKEQNPGFDLLLDTPWNSLLFGDETQPPPPADGQKQQSRPQLVPIPSGRRQ